MSLARFSDALVPFLTIQDIFFRGTIWQHEVGLIFRILNVCTIITDSCSARVAMLLHNKNCITSFIISNAFSCPCPSSFVSCVTFFESLYIEGHIAANTVFNESILNYFWEAKRHEIFMLLC